jgi:hypothetical protein
MSEEVEELLKAIGGGIGKKKGKGGLTKGQKESMIADFMAQPTSYPVGTHLRRNRFGMKKYRLPVDDDDVFVVCDVFDHQFHNKDGDIIHGTAATLAYNDNKTKYKVETFGIDFRYYEKKE